MQILFENQINCWQPPPLVQTLDWLAVKDEGILIWHSAVVYGLVFQYYTPNIIFEQWKNIMPSKMEVAS